MDFSTYCFCRSMFLRFILCITFISHHLFMKFYPPYMLPPCFTYIITLWCRLCCNVTGPRLPNELSGWVQIWTWLSQTTTLYCISCRESAIMDCMIWLAKLVCQKLWSPWPGPSLNLVGYILWCNMFGLWGEKLCVIPISGRTQALILIVLQFRDWDYFKNTVWGQVGISV